MTVAEFYDRVESFTEDERVEWCSKMIKLMCRLSLENLNTFQETWNPDSKGLKWFFAEQAKLFKICIRLEWSPVGEAVRHVDGLLPLFLETELV